MEITLKLFFEIKDSELFGGIGKAGYIESGMEISGEDLEQVNLRRYAEEQKKGIAQMCGVTEAKVEIISEERYKICAEEEESSSVAKIVQREENVLQNRCMRYRQGDVGQKIHVDGNAAVWNAGKKRNAMSGAGDRVANGNTQKNATTMQK